ncbi:MAG: B12-binding domain-containing radical SAM protein [Candidatus Omnitrophica bacterium]|nr:B12-binding domain-containing radical SAM protein [Candidatus Omnitrophota bacterium]
MKAERKKQNYPEILFLFPDFEAEDFSAFTLDYHLGAGYILAYLKAKGIFARQFIHREPISLPDLIDRILKQRLKVIGFTCYDTNYYYVKLIAQLLKKKNPELTIIAGGPTATFSDELIMQDNPAIDICVRGEGEYTVYELVKRLRTSRDISDIKGITHRSKGRIVQTSDRPLIKGERENEELDAFPSPYLSNIIPAGENFGILTSRGCIFRCIYCNFSAMSRWTIRYHSVERVISELKMIDRGLQGKTKKIESRGMVLIYDDVFSLNLERAKRICRRIIEKKIDLPLWVETRADRIDKELLYLMRQAGVKKISFGLESASPEVLYTVKKVRPYPVSKGNLTPEKRYVAKTKTYVSLAKKIGIMPTVSVIMGLPGATVKDNEKTIEFVKQLKLKLYFHNYLKIFPGTELFATYKRYGLKLRQSLTTLPYKTEYAYDIYKIPEMKNSSQQAFTKGEQAESVIRIITGANEKLNDGNYPDVLLKSHLVDSETIDWLKRSVKISPTIVFINGCLKESKDSLLHRNIKKMHSSGLPAANFYLLTPLNKNGLYPANPVFESEKYELMHATEIATNRRRSFSKLDFLRFIPFKNYAHNHSAFPDMKNKKKNKVIFTISTFDDIENLVRLFSHSNSMALKGDMAKRDCYFLDECRWSGGDCPAARFNRAIIKNDGSIIPCFNGKPIARVGDEQKDIARCIRLLWEETKKRRGCRDCPLRDNCSKCLFPYPMDEKEYCRLRRKLYPDLNKFFEQRRKIGKIKTFNRDLFLA